MRVPLFLLIAVSLAVFSVESYSQQPAHNNQQPAPTKNQNSGGGNISSHSPAASGQMVPTPNSGNNAETGKQEWYSTFLDYPTDWLLAIFTFFLALYTARLFYATNGLVSAAQQQSVDIGKAIKAIEDMAAATATANELTENAMLKTDRPWVGAESVGWIIPTDLISPHPQPSEVSKIEAHIINWGKSPAFKLRAEFKGSIRAATDAHPEPPTTPLSETPSGVAFPNFKTRYGPFYGWPDLTAEKLAEINSNASFMWIVGRIDYIDRDDNPHFTTVVFWWNPYTKSFITHGTHAT